MLINNFTKVFSEGQTAGIKIIIKTIQIKFPLIKRQSANNVRTIIARDIIKAYPDGSVR